jgi:hypothetical protein
MQYLTSLVVINLPKVGDVFTEQVRLRDVSIWRWYKEYEQGEEIQQKDLQEIFSVIIKNSYEGEEKKNQSVIDTFIELIKGKEGKLTKWSVESALNITLLQTIMTAASKGNKDSNNEEEEEEQ